MESSLFTEPRRWAEASLRKSRRGEPKQKIRFNLDERSHSLDESDVSRSDFTNLITSLVETNKLLYEELEQIQKDHQRTVQTLSQCYEMKKSEEKLSRHVPRGILKNVSKTSACHDSSGKQNSSRSRNGKIKMDKWKSVSKTVDDTVKVRGIPREISSSTSVNPESEEENLSYTNESSEDSASSGRDENSEQNNKSCQASCGEQRSLGMDAVKSMWDNFSLKDYDFITYDDGPIVKSKQSSSYWARKFTVPEPFKMTVRESAKKKKGKAEEASKPVDDPELDVRVQPVRIPPSTLMPIYELMRARDKQKKMERKKEILNKMKSTLKPFSFEARESQKQEKKAELLKIGEEENYSKPDTFKARPVPSKLFDPEVKEKILEEEDYRRIRRRMRSDELLASSRLPRRMHESEQNANKTGLLRKVADESEDNWFHPRISHEIPDYEVGYSKLRNKLAEKKRSKILTIPEPFRLKTEELSLRRKKKEAVKAQCEAETKPKKDHLSPRVDLARQPALPSHTTQAQKLRQKKIKERRSALELKEMEEEERHKARKLERQIMQKIVKEAADKMYSSTLKQEEKRKRQAEERRRQQKMKSRKFYKELQEMDERVAARPLLLENFGSSRHKDKSEEFYSHALQKAGYSHKEIKKFLDSFQKEKSSTSDDPD